MAKKCKESKKFMKHVYDRRSNRDINAMRIKF